MKYKIYLKENKVIDLTNNRPVEYLQEKEILTQFKESYQKVKAEEYRHEKHYGKTRPIVAGSGNGDTLIAVGNKIYYSSEWKTFHDFLLDYPKYIFGGNWGNSELKKEFEKRHPILQWYEIIVHSQKEHMDDSGKIQSMLITGAISAYMNLSYYLYLISHNVQLEKKLIKRLKSNNMGAFTGAYYETYVISCFIKAGFEIEYENESDPSSMHCEFIATHQKTNKKYSVEAKARMKGKSHAKVSKQLFNALKKQADHERIIFIDINLPEKTTTIEKTKWIRESIESIRELEPEETINGNKTPKAYIFLTNHPNLYNLESVDSGKTIIAEGFKIPNFKWENIFTDLDINPEIEKEHKEAYDILLSLKNHHKIPATFNVETD